MKTASSSVVIRILSYAAIRGFIVGYCIVDGVLGVFAFGAVGFGFERAQA